MRETTRIIQDLGTAVGILRNGELLAFPTETVYGLGADAQNPQAIKKVFAAKGRPADHPLIVHLGDVLQLNQWADDIPDSVWILAEHFWPGPLTMILNKQPQVSTLITGGQDTIALRIPAHPLALKLLQEFGSALVGPSANKYGCVSPTTAMHVLNDFSGEITVLDGGSCTVGIESTIISLVGEYPIIMRQGAISANELSTVLGSPVALNINQEHKIRSPGAHAAHYAPNTPVYLIAADALLQTANEYLADQQKFSVISLQARPKELPREIHWQQMANNPIVYAQTLYATLRTHDQLQTNAILIEQVPADPSWAAIADRLARACVKQ